VAVVAGSGTAAGAAASGASVGTGVAMGEDSAAAASSWTVLGPRLKRREARCLPAEILLPSEPTVLVPFDLNEPPTRWTRVAVRLKLVLMNSPTTNRF